MALIRLPLDVLATVVHFLSNEEKPSVRLVCVRFREAAYRRLRSANPEWFIRLQLSMCTTEPLRPVPPGVTLECFIIRDRTVSRYSLWSECPRRLLLTTVRQKVKMCSHFPIWSNVTDETHPENGKLCANLWGSFLGTEYTLGCSHPGDDRETELGAIIFDRDIFGRNPKRLRMLLPSIPSEDPTLQPLLASKTNLLLAYKTGQSAGFTLLENIEPPWNEQYGTYMLNFNGRVRISSTKNFQMANPADSDKIVLLQSGKVEDDKFILDFQHPLSLVQAFAIALSGLDQKLACR